jgi:hypothetical protein
MDTSQKPEGLPVAPWTPEELKEVVSELIGLFEEWDKTDSVKTARAAKLSDDLVKQIEQDASMPAFCKGVFVRTIPALAAKYLNQAGLPATGKDETLLLMAVLYMAYDKFSRSRDIKKLAAAASQPSK